MRPYLRVDHVGTCLEAEVEMGFAQFIDQLLPLSYGSHYQLYNSQLIKDGCIHPPSIILSFKNVLSVHQAAIFASYLSCVPNTISQNLLLTP